MKKHGGKFRLTKLNLDEISLVAAGDDPMARTVLSKGLPDGKSMSGNCSHKRKTRGGRCKDCGGYGLMKSMSYDEKRELVHGAHGRKDTYVESMSDDWVIFANYGIDQGPTKYTKMSYAIMDGEVTFGAPEMVERKTVWALSKNTLDATDFPRRDLMKRAVANPKSTPKEIHGSHGHRPHGKSILWPALYEHLRRKGKSKAAAAAISNSAWKKKRMGIATNTPTSARGAL
jgi:hypothetical protein